MRNKSDHSELAEAVQALKDDFKNFKDDVKSLFADLGHAGKEGVASAGRHLRDGAKRGVEAARERVNQAKEYGSKKLGDLEEQVEAHPWATAFIALGLGALLGRYFRR